MRHTIFWNGLKNMQLECYLQPIYDVQNNKINVAEALFRARQHNGTWFDTEQLIANLEANDCITDVDLWMLEQVCKNMRKLEAVGIERVNVNLSPRFYMDESMISEIRRIMREYKVMSSQIWFELTEFADVEDKETLRRLIIKLTGTGFRFALDDFGKGQSNLIRLFDYPFHCIKLDKELTWKLDQGQESDMTRCMLEHIIEFAHRFAICVTAEGIENAEQAKILISMGCDFLQGYMISRPLPLDEFLLFVQSYHCRPFGAGTMEKTIIGG